MLNKPENFKTGKMGENGYSIIELVIVMLIVSILSVMALLSFKSEKQYLADTSARQIIDLFQEARQRSLTQRETMRVEINQTRKIARLISENEPGNSDDDEELRQIQLEDERYVMIGAAPSNISKQPTEISPVPVLNFKTSVYPLSQSDTVATLRFVRNGKVLDAGSNAIGDNSVITGATIYIWMPNLDDNDKPLSTGGVIRAITVIGNSGMSSFLKCPVVEGVCQEWAK